MQRIQLRQVSTWGVGLAALSVVIVPAPADGQTFQNTGSITIPDNGPAAPYPSTIAVSGLDESIASMTVSLSGLSHSFPDDIDILLVGPGGEVVLLMSDAGGGDNVSIVNLTFMDGAAALPDNTQILSGTYQPTNYDALDGLAPPAPDGLYASVLSAFAGTDGNGTWSLYVIDDAGQDTGSISGGWSVTIVQEPPPPPVTYQGQLRQSALPLNGDADLEFSLFDAETNGTQVFPTIAVDGATVANGLFTAELPFSSTIFNGSERWLEIAVRSPAGSGDFTTLSPRQRITPAPVATHARRATSALAAAAAETAVLADFAQAAFTLAAPSGGPTEVIIDQFGNVGVGTPTPDRKLEVEDFQAIVRLTTGGTSSGSTLELRNNNATQTILGRVSFLSSSGSTRGQIAYRGTDETMTFHTSAAEQMRIDSGGNLGIGTATPTTKLSVSGDANVTGNVGIGTDTPARSLHVSNGSSGGASPTATDLLVEDDGTCYVNLMAPDVSEHGLVFGSPADNNHGGVYYANASGLSLRTGGNVTRMIINDLGNVTIGRGESNDARMHLAGDSPNRPLKVDLQGGDGQLVGWARDDTVIGTVTVAGGVVSYNAFTGSHYAWHPKPLDRGTLVSMTGANRRQSADGEVIYGIELTRKANDPACLGAYLAPHTTSESLPMTDEHQVMSVGNGEMWVIDTGSDIAPGDLLISSHVSGCAMRDDPVKFPVGHIVARAAEAVRWSDLKPDSEGLRRARISVLFDRFTRSMDPAALSALYRELTDLRTRLERRERQIRE